ncbi:MAG: hypothetical protein KJ646_00235 [Nanoarchaeota archaeon]|nr:hypothetical protein [Nanoarchaeota archaeon]MBU4116554.1 hypothetical protein [Nanoarchaeota archaeon]
MVKKKSSSKKITKRKTASRKRNPRKTNIIRTTGEIKVERLMIENFISLQKVLTNVSIKFDNLTQQISKLLELFEISAKSLAEKDFNLEQQNKENEQISEKLNNIAEQNKTIARGLTLIHETSSGKIPQQTPLMPPINPETNQLKSPDAEKYEKSISSVP